MEVWYSVKNMVSANQASGSTGWSWEVARLAFLAEQTTGICMPGTDTCSHIGQLAARQAEGQATARQATCLHCCCPLCPWLGPAGCRPEVHAEPLLICRHQACGNPAP